MTAGDRWLNVDRTVLVENADGSGSTYSRTGAYGWASVENMAIVRQSPFWTREP